MATAPKFEADISADISKFLREMEKVDKKIKDLASGVIIDIDLNLVDFRRSAQQAEDRLQDLSNDVDINILGDTSDLERAIREANEQIANLNDDSTVNINGNNSNFNNSVNDVNKQSNKLSRRITEARIGADIGDFESRMVEVARALAEADETVTPRIEADVIDFNRDIIEVQDRMREIARTTANPQVEADIAGFMAQMELVQRQLNDVVDTHDIDIRADTTGARIRLRLLMEQIRSMTAKDHIIKLKASWANYQAVMGAMATFTRNFSEVVGMVGRGIMISMSPAIVPVIATLVGLLGNLGPMLGTVAGSTFAFATAASAAVLGLGGFAAVAAPTIKDLFDIEEGVKRGSKEWYAMSQETRKAVDSIDAFQGNWGNFRETMDKPVTTAFTDFMETSNKLLNLFKPAIEGSVEAVGNLMKSLSAAADGAQVKSFFEWLGTTAGKHLETLGKGLGNFLLGIMNMFVAFGPLADSTMAGFAKMGEGFAEWSAGLSENKGFQKFTAYVTENMPKIRSIFSDAIQGVIHMFAAFGDSSSSMMTKLADMMEGFLNWSKALGESQGFKSFIDYIQTNGPVVVSTIGEIVDFIINLGIAAAPMGEKLLGMVNAMLNFANSMMEAHPWLGKIAIGAVVMIGAFLAALPVIVGLNALLGGLITRFILMGATWLVTAAKMAAGWIIAMGPIGWITVAVVALAVLIYKYWDEISAWTVSTWSKVSTAATEALDKIMAWVNEKFPGIYNIINLYMTMAKDMLIVIWELIKGTFSNALAWLKALVNGDFQGMKDAANSQMTLMKESLSKIWGMVKDNFSTITTAIWNLVKEKFASMAVSVLKYMSETKTNISNKWEEAKSATGTKIASLVTTAITKFAQLVTKVAAKMTEAKTAISNKWEEAKSATRSKLTQLVSAVVTFFAQVVSRVREKMSEAVRVLGEKVGQMPGKVKSYVGQMLSAGADLVRGLINGIKNMAGAAIEAISGVVGGVISKAKSLLNINSPSRVFSEFGGFISEGLAIGVSDKARLAVDSVSNMATAMTNAFNPQMELANLNASANLDTSVSRADMGVVRKSFAAEIDSGDDTQPAIYVTNELVGDKILTVVNRGQAKKSRLTDGFYGK